MISIAEASAPSHPETVTWLALGTRVSVVVADPAQANDVATLVRAQLDELDRACSRFRDDSELARVNHAAGAWSEASALFREGLRAALRAARLTGGAVDPTIGRTLRLAGYDRDFAELSRSGRRRIGFAETPGWRTVEVDEPRGAVRVARGVELDLGATAKAFAADRAARGAAAAAGCGVLVNVGGDVAVAGDSPPGGWPVRVTDDHAAGPDAPGQTVSIHSGGLATSSTTVRQWNAGGKHLHHIVDPATGRPAEVVWRTVSVAAASCVDANTGSTAAIVRGRAAPQWLRDVGLPARLVTGDGAVVRIGGWPEDGAE